MIYNLEKDYFRLGQSIQIRKGDKKIRKKDLQFRKGLLQIKKEYTN